MDIQLPFARQDVEVELNASPFLVPGKLAAQNVFIFLGGLFVAYLTLTAHTIRSFPVNRGVVSGRSTRLSLVIPTAASPQQLELSEDLRQLGIYLTSITFKTTHHDAGQLFRRLTRGGRRRCSETAELPRPLSPERKFRPIRPPADPGTEAAGPVTADDAAPVRRTLPIGAIELIDHQHILGLGLVSAHTGRADRNRGSGRRCRRADRPCRPAAAGPNGARCR